jgi:hypothetical protein
VTWIEYRGIGSTNDIHEGETKPLRARENDGKELEISRWKDVIQDMLGDAAI